MLLRNIYSESENCRQEQVVLSLEKPLIWKAHATWRAKQTKKSREFTSSESFFPPLKVQPSIVAPQIANSQKNSGPFCLHSLLISRDERSKKPLSRGCRHNVEKYVPGKDQVAGAVISALAGAKIGSVG
jgi:hypothetical protein